MSERKVLTKYYPPDFDPAAIGRVRKPKDVVKKLDTVRLMAPFSMKCASCGEYIYKGRKFNARKQITDETYYNIKIIRFYIKCTRCSAELTFKTDPKHNDYAAERNIRRSFEPWREAKLAEETEEERLDRLEQEERDRDPMAELEAKAYDAEKEMEVENALDEMRMRNARMERKDKEGVSLGQGQKTEAELERERLDAEDMEAAKRAFQNGSGEGRVKRLMDHEDEGNLDVKTDGYSVNGQRENEEVIEEKKTHIFSAAKKRKTDYGAALGIRKSKVDDLAKTTSTSDTTITTPKPLVDEDDDFW